MQISSPISIFDTALTSFILDSWSYTFEALAQHEWLNLHNLGNDILKFWKIAVLNFLKAIYVISCVFVLFLVIKTVAYFNFYRTRIDFGHHRKLKKQTKKVRPTFKIKSGVNQLILTPIQPGKGRFTLTYMSHDYLNGSHAGLPGWMRVKSTGKAFALQLRDPGSIPCEDDVGFLIQP